MWITSSSAWKGAEIMKSNSLILAVCVLILGVAASAGTLSGNVKGQGKSVVYLEASPGKAPAAAPTQVYKMDQKGMKFVRSVWVVPVGATVEFDNTDAGAHNYR